MPGPAWVPKHGTEGGHHLDFGLRALDSHHLGERVRALRRIGVRDPDPPARLVPRRADERAHELGERLRVAANALDRLDLLLDHEDRLDVQQLAGERARAADSAAAPRNSSVSTVKRRPARG